MKSLLVTCFVFISIECKSQIYVSKSYRDSLNAIRKANIGKQFPDFKVTDIDGNNFSNSDLEGKITLINFWFEGCHPCVAEFAALNDIFEKFYRNKSFNFITFTFEYSSDIKKNVKKYSLKALVKSKLLLRKSIVLKSSAFQFGSKWKI